MGTNYFLDTEDFLSKEEGSCCIRNKGGKEC